MSVPRASGYFRTRYDQELRLLDTRTQRIAFGAFGMLSGFSHLLFFSA